jgi:mRNA interferase RelE/StbE
VASAYEVEVENSAARAVQRLQRHDQIRAVQAMADLATEPRPDGCTKLSGMGSAYRVRVGNYRIVYAVDDAERLVTVTRVGHRWEVYR